MTTGKHKKILITGSTGLVGSHLVRALMLEGNYELYTLGLHSQNETNHITVDLSSSWELKNLPTEMDYIIHLAQSRNFREFPNKAEDIFNVNTVSTFKLADWAYRVRAEKFIYASTGGVYEQSALPLEEAERIRYQSQNGFYSTSKYCSEVILENYSSFFDLIILRLFFVYGNGQDPNMLIPRLAGNIKGRKPVPLKGKVGLTINPVHVSDVVRAILGTFQLKGNHLINIAGSQQLSIREICDIIGELVGMTPVYQLEEGPSPFMTADISSMVNLIGKPQVSFSAGINDLL